jgi:hypothetical protein
MGLGLVPVRADGTCRFGAIDIDEYGIDHQDLTQRVVTRNMPLAVCRSKSGGAHLYLFIQEPGLPAAEIQTLLKHWAALLGYPRAEVFPKQTNVSQRNVGNWINLPYFSGDDTTRYAVGPGGKTLTLQEFLASVRYYEPNLPVDTSVSADVKEMPPCLQALSQHGLPEGFRNMGLFNYAVFYRKASPEDWQNKVIAHNAASVHPPLPVRDVQAIIKSVGKTDYQYLCEQEPIHSHCDRATCVTMEYGVGSRSADHAGSNYAIVGGRICHMKAYNNLLVPEPLCNFEAEIVEEIVQDDGVETTCVFILKGKLAGGRLLPRGRVPAGRFSSLGWVPELWGHAAVINAGFAQKDRLREAIQCLSPHAEIRYVYVHTGWRVVDGKWVFLTGSGAVGREGVEVDLGTGLDRYQLPTKAENPAEAMRASLRLLNVAPDSVTVPLFAAMFRAPLAHAFPADLSLHLEGHTGGLKSTLVGLFLSHHGDFDEKHLPGSWNSTANALERQAFLLKDVPFVVDDYAPPAQKVREFESKFGLLMRAQGNLQGRARMRPDASLRPTYIPRGLIISTGETHPPGQSLVARVLIMEVEREHVKLDLVSEAQQTKHQLLHAMAGYITRLAPKMPDLRKELEKLFKERRAPATLKGEHLRIPGTIAHLWLGVEMALRYAEEIRAVTRAEAEDYRARSWEALKAQGREQAQVVEGERPTLRFLKVLGSLFAQGRVGLLEKSKEMPDPKSHVTFVGWTDEEKIYLNPEAAFSAVVRACQEQGEPFATRMDRLAKDFKREGLSETNEGRNQLLVHVGGRKRRVWCLRRGTIDKLLGEEFPVGRTGIVQRDLPYWKEEL